MVSISISFQFPLVDLNLRPRALIFVVLMDGVVVGPEVACEQALGSSPLD